MARPLYDDGTLIVGPHTPSDRPFDTTAGYGHVLTFTLQLVDGAIVLSKHGEPIPGPVAADLHVREVEQLHEALGEWLQERGRA